MIFCKSYLNMYILYPKFSWCYNEVQEKLYGVFIVWKREYFIRHVGTNDLSFEWCPELTTKQTVNLAATLENDTHTVRFFFSFFFSFFNIREYQYFQYYSTQLQPELTCKAIVVNKDLSEMYNMILYYSYH